MSYIVRVIVLNGLCYISVWQHFENSSFPDTSFHTVTVNEGSPRANSVVIFSSEFYAKIIGMVHLHYCSVLVWQVKGIIWCKILVGRWTDLSTFTFWKGQCTLFRLCLWFVRRKNEDCHGYDVLVFLSCQTTYDGSSVKCWLLLLLIL